MSLDSLRASLVDRYRIEGELGQGGMARELAAEGGDSVFNNEYATSLLSRRHHRGMTPRRCSGQAAAAGAPSFRPPPLPSTLRPPSSVVPTSAISSPMPITPHHIRYFPSPAAFRKWLTANHAKADELWVGFHKKHTDKPSLTWPESVDQALCFGWIDGQRRRIDDDRYTIRFTPRRKGSIWSAVNVKRIKELSKEGLVEPAGMVAFEARKENKTAIYSYEKRPEVLPAPFEKTFRRNRKAWDYFEKQPPSYRRAVINWVVSAKREATRERRLAQLIADCAAGEWIKQMRWGKR